MATKDISDRDVIQACHDVRDETAEEYEWFAISLLADRTGQPQKVCWRAMERAHDRGFIEYGVSLRTAWPTDKGLAILRGQN